MYIVTYIVLTIVVVGFASWKLTREGFLLAGRDVSPFMAGMSLVVSKFGGGLILAYGSLVFIFGLGAAWFYVGFVLGYILFFGLARKLKKLSDENEFYTLTDFYKKTAGDGAVLPIGFLCAYSMIGLTCVNIVGGAQILNQIAGLSYEVSVLFVALFIGSYLLFGGFKTVIATDFLQGLIICAAIAMLIFFAVSPDININVSDFFFSLKNLPIIYLFFLGLSFPFGMPEVWPRIYALSSRKHLGITLCGTMAVFVGLGLLLTGLILGFREGFTGMPPPQAILMGFQSILPEYFSGVIAIFFFAIIMSSADTYVFQSIAAIEQDLKISRFFKLSKYDLRFRMRIGTAFILLLSVAVAFIMPDIVKVVLLFTAGNFILGVFGIISRFVTLKESALCMGSVFGVIALVASVFAFGVGFYAPLSAAAGTFLGIIISLLQNVNLPFRQT